MSEIQRIERIKKLIIVAMFSDDEFLETLVLKGGNAVDLIHGAAMRGSLDLDFSLESDFPEPDPAKLRARFEALLNTTFEPEGLIAFDVAFVPKPLEVSADMRDFWGGYELEFKLIPKEKLDSLAGDQRLVRHAAENVDRQRRKRFRVDFSRHEYCAPKEEKTLDGYTIYVYTPAMIVCEKLRAVCQQTEDYGRIVKKSRAGAARAKDFFDIFTLVEHFGMDLAREEIIDLLKAMFAAKRVPLHLLGQVPRYRELHRSGFESVRQTVKPGVRLRDFDFYFDYVIRLTEKLKPLWNVEPPPA